jgi:hypothetical protein
MQFGTCSHRHPSPTKKNPVSFRVMIFRRITGVLLAAFTLHLNVLGADFACAKHGPGDHESVAAVATDDAAAPSHAEHASVSAEHSAHNHASVASTVPSVTNPPAPCDVPVQPNCCKALTSCSVYFSSGSELTIAGVDKVPDFIAPNAMTAPPSVRSAPEPPPPKA